MNDQLLISNYLLVLKSTVEVFVHGTLESSHQDVRMLLKSGLGDIITCQGDTYAHMIEEGWYSVSDVNTSQISDTLTKISEQ